jgi:hypothetical protein
MAAVLRPTTVLLQRRLQHEQNLHDPEGLRAPWSIFHFSTGPLPTERAMVFGTAGPRLPGVPKTKRVGQE